MLPKTQPPSRLRRLLAGALAVTLAGAGLSLAAVAPAAAAEGPSPTVTLSVTTELPRTGATITVDGTGFEPSTFDPTNRGSQLDKVPGMYVAVGPKSAIDHADWNMNIQYYSNAKQVSPVASDGAFRVELANVVPVFASGDAEVDCGVVECGVYTWANHTNFPFRDHDTYTPISFAAPAVSDDDGDFEVTPTPIPDSTPTGATVTLSGATKVDAKNGTVTVKGANFKPTVPGTFGVYVAVGPKTVQDATDRYSNAERYASFEWVRSIPADGTFSQVLTGLTSAFTSGDTAVDCQTAECGVYTFAAHGSKDRSQDTYTPITFVTGGSQPGKPVTDPTHKPEANPTAPTEVPATAMLSEQSVTAGESLLVTGSGFTPNEKITITLRPGEIVLGSITADVAGKFRFDATIPADVLAGNHSIVAIGAVSGKSVSVGLTVNEPEKVCVARSVDGASLDWGVKESFRNYITGGIAKGSVDVSGVAYSGGDFTWSGGSGAYNTELDMGQVSYPGSVHFEGHDGVLTLTLTAIRIQVDSASGATLIADVDSSDMEGTKAQYSGIAFASIGLDGNGAFGSAVAMNNAPATLTAAGAAAFAGFYEAGAALDGVSFVFPLGGETDCTTLSGAGLASTGFDQGVNLMLFAGVFLLGGIAVLVVARRRQEARI